MYADVLSKYSSDKSIIQTELKSYEGFTDFLIFPLKMANVILKAGIVMKRRGGFEICKAAS